MINKIQNEDENFFLFKVQVFRKIWTLETIYNNKFENKFQLKK